MFMCFKWICSDISLNCTLWEDYAAMFIKYNSERKQGGPVVVMLKYAKIKEEGDIPTYVFVVACVSPKIDFCCHQTLIIQLKKCFKHLLFH